MKKIQKSITDSVNSILEKSGLPLDHITEAYSYGIARTVRERLSLNVAAALPADVQGFMSSPAERKIIEDHAVTLARGHFESQGYAVKIYGKPYDLRCMKNGETVYVEVKGTQGSGTEILLTKGEVRFNRDKSNNMALFVVSEIDISPDSIASGGKSTIKMPWIIDEDQLEPCAFTYRV